MAVDANWLYFYADNTKLARIPKSGGAQQPIAPKFLGSRYFLTAMYIYGVFDSGWARVPL